MNTRRLEERIRDGVRADPLTEGILAAAAAVFRAGVSARAGLYACGLLRAERAAVPVVSVGNLTVGGTGKTPFVRYLARALLARGRLPSILLRGYGPSPRQPKLAFPGIWRSVGDEAALLASWLPGVPVVACRNRRRGARAALTLAPMLDLLLLDDGFQHRRLARDLDIVLLDASDPWGGGRLFPAGRLREPPAALARAQAVVITRAGAAKDLESLRRDVQRLAPGALLAVAEDIAIGILGHSTGERRSLEWLSGREILAVAAIGRPAAFAASLERLGARVELAAFRDHHEYTGQEVDGLVSRARGRVIVTTEKDAIRWPGDRPADLWVLQSALGFREGERALIEAVLALASGSTRPRSRRSCRAGTPG